MARNPEFADVTQQLYQQGSTDGLPVVPPTEERVAAMLRGTDRDPEEEIARLGNREGLLTVEQVAINGVMAGCLPPHMPVLMAGARMLADPQANAIQVTTSTGSWSYMWLINGPIRRKLTLRHDLEPGPGSNRLIGRALGLIYKNTAVVHPGEKEMSVQGSPFKFDLVAAEHEEANPWEPYHVTQGYAETANALTFGGPHSLIQYTGGDDDPEDLLSKMIYNLPPSVERVSETGRSVFATHGLTPDDAETLAAAGFSKTEVKRYLLENTSMTKAKQHTGVNRQDEHDAVEPLRPAHHPDPDQIAVPVLGETGEANVALGPALSGLVTKEIRLPDGWDSLREEYSLDTPRLLG